MSYISGCCGCFDPTFYHEHRRVRDAAHGAELQVRAVVARHVVPVPGLLEERALVPLVRVGDVPPPVCEPGLVQHRLVVQLHPGGLDEPKVGTASRALLHYYKHLYYCKQHTSS